MGSAGLRTRPGPRQPLPAECEQARTYMRSAVLAKQSLRTQANPLVGASSLARGSKTRICAALAGRVRLKAQLQCYPLAPARLSFNGGAQRSGLGLEIVLLDDVFDLPGLGDA